MKKWKVLMICIILAFGASACGGSKTSEKDMIPSRQNKRVKTRMTVAQTKRMLHKKRYK